MQKYSPVSSYKQYYRSNIAAETTPQYREDREFEYTRRSQEKDILPGIVSYVGMLGLGWYTLDKLSKQYTKQFKWTFLSDLYGHRAKIEQLQTGERAISDAVNRAREKTDMDSPLVDLLGPTWRERIMSAHVDTKAQQDHNLNTITTVLDVLIEEAETTGKLSSTEITLYKDNIKKILKSDILSTIYDNAPRNVEYIRANLMQIADDITGKLGTNYIDFDEVIRKINVNTYKTDTQYYRNIVKSVVKDIRESAKARTTSVFQSLAAKESAVRDHLVFRGMTKFYDSIANARLMMPGELLDYKLALMETANRTAMLNNKPELFIMEQMYKDADALITSINNILDNVPEVDRRSAEYLRTTKRINFNDFDVKYRPPKIKGKKPKWGKVYEDIDTLLKNYARYGITSPAQIQEIIKGERQATPGGLAISTYEIKKQISQSGYVDPWKTNKVRNLIEDEYVSELDRGLRKETIQELIKEDVDDRGAVAIVQNFKKSTNRNGTLDYWLRAGSIAPIVDTSTNIRSATSKFILDADITYSIDALINGTNRTEIINQLRERRAKDLATYGANKARIGSAILQKQRVGNYVGYDTFSNIFDSGFTNFTDNFLSRADEVVREVRARISDTELANKEIAERLRRLGQQFVGGIEVTQFQTESGITEQSIRLLNINNEKIRDLNFPLKLTDSDYRDLYFDSDNVFPESHLVKSGRQTFFAPMISLDGTSSGIYRPDALRVMYNNYLSKVIREVSDASYFGLQKIDHFDLRASSTVKAVYNMFDIVKAHTEQDNPIVKSLFAAGDLRKSERVFLSKVGNAYIDYRDMLNNITEKGQTNILMFDTETFGLKSLATGELGKLRFDEKGTPIGYLGHAYSISFVGVRLDQKGTSAISLDEMIKISPILAKETPILQSKGRKGRVMLPGQILIREPLVAMRKALDDIKKGDLSAKKTIESILAIQPTKYMQTFEGFSEWLTMVTDDVEKYTVEYKDVQNTLSAFFDKGYLGGAYNKQFDEARMQTQKYRSIDVMYHMMGLGKTKDNMPLINFMQTKDLSFIREQYGITLETEEGRAALRKMMKSVYNATDDQINQMFKSDVFEMPHFAPFDTITTAMAFMRSIDQRTLPGIQNTNKELISILGEFGNHLSGLINGGWGTDDPSTLMRKLYRDGQFNLILNGVIDKNNVYNNLTMLISPEAMAKGTVLKPNEELSLSTFYFEASAPHKQMYQRFNTLFMWKVATSGDLSTRSRMKSDITNLFSRPVWDIGTVQNRHALHYSGNIIGTEVGTASLMNGIIRRTIGVVSPSGDMSDIEKSMAEGLILHGGVAKHGGIFKDIRVDDKHLLHLNGEMADIMHKEGLEIDFKTNKIMADAYYTVRENAKALQEGIGTSQERDLRIKLTNSVTDFQKLANDVQLNDEITLYSRNITDTKRIQKTFGRGMRIAEINFTEAGTVSHIGFSRSRDPNESIIKMFVLGNKGQVVNEPNVIGADARGLLGALESEVDGAFTVTHLNQALKKKRGSEIYEAFLITSVLPSGREMTSTAADVHNNINKSISSAKRSFIGDPDRLDFTISLTSGDKIKTDISKADFFELRMKYELGHLDTQGSALDTILKANHISIGEVDVNKTMQDSVHSWVTGSIQGKAVVKGTQTNTKLINDYHKFIYDVVKEGFIDTNRVYTRDEMRSFTRNELGEFINTIASVFNAQTPADGKTGQYTVGVVNYQKYQQMFNDGVATEKIADEVVNDLGANGMMPKLLKKVTWEGKNKKQTNFIVDLFARHLVLDTMETQAGEIRPGSAAKIRLNIDNDLRFMVSMFERGGAKGESIRFAKEYMQTYQVNRSIYQAYNVIRQGYSSLSDDRITNVVNNKIGQYDLTRMQQGMHELRTIDPDAPLRLARVDLNNNTIVGDTDLTIDRLGTLIGNLNKLTREAGTAFKDETPGVYMYRGSIVDLDTIKRMNPDMTPEQLLEELKEAQVIHTRQMILNTSPDVRGNDIDTREMLMAELNSKNKNVISLSFKVDDANSYTVAAISPYTYGTTQLADKFGTTKNVTLFNQDMATLSAFYQSVEAYKEAQRAKKPAAVLSELNDNIRRAAEAHQNTMGRILEGKQTHAAPIVNVPYGIRGTATILDAADFIGEDTLLASVSSSKTFSRMIASGGVKGRDELGELLESTFGEQEYKKVKMSNGRRKILLDTEQYGHLNIGTRINSLAGDGFIAIGEDEVADAIEMQNEHLGKKGLKSVKAIEVSRKIYGSAFQQSYPETSDPIPLRTFITDKINEGSIAVDRFTRRTIYKDVDTDQVALAFFGITSNTKLRNIINNNQVEGFRDKMNKSFGNNIRSMFSFATSRNLIDADTGSIDLRNINDRIDMLREMTPFAFQRGLIDEESLRADANGEQFMLTMKSLMPELTGDEEVWSFLDGKETHHNFLFMDRSAYMDATKGTSKVVNSDEIFDEFLSQTGGKRSIPQAYMLSRGLKKAITEGLERPDLDQEMIAKMHDMPSLIYELAVKSIKSTNRAQSNIIANAVSEAHAGNYQPMVNIIGKSAANESQLSTATSIAKLASSYIYKHKETMNLFEDISATLGTRAQVSLSQSMIDTLASSDAIDMLAGRTGKMTANDVGIDINKTANKIVNAFGSAKMAGVAGIVAGAMILGNPNQSAFYDQDTPGYTNGEDSDRDIRWTFNNPTRYFERDLNVKSQLAHNLAVQMQTQQKLYAFKAQESRSSLYNIKLRSNKQKFFSL